MTDVVCRNPGYWDGSRSSVGKMESARRSGALSGMTMGGEELDPNRRKVGFSKSITKKVKKTKKEVEVKSKLSAGPLIGFKFENAHAVRKFKRAAIKEGKETIIVLLDCNCEKNYPIKDFPQVSDRCEKHQNYFVKVGNGS